MMKTNENESLLQIIQAIPDPLTVIEADTGICLEANNRFHFLTGYTREETIGHTARELDIWVQPGERCKLIEGVQANGFVEELEADFRRKDGSIFTGIMSARLITLEGKKCIITVTKDITQRKALETALEEREGKYRYLYDNSLVAMFTTTLQGKPVDVNTVTLKMLGYPDKETFVSEFTALNHWVHPESRDQLVRMALEHGVVHGFKGLARRRDGSTFWSEFSVRLNQDQQTLEVFALDISERKRVQDENQLLLSIIRNSHDFIGVATAGQQAVYVNPAGREMVGLDNEEAATRTKIEEYFLPADLPFLRENIIPELLKKGRWAGEFRFRHFKTGEPIQVLYDLFLTEDPLTGEVRNIATISRNISELKKYQEELIRAKERAEESDRLKSAFLANMSHEIRTPMNGILGFTELLNEPDLTGDERQHYLEIIRRSGNRLLDTVNDLIDISRIETGQMPVVLSDVPVNMMMDHLMAFFKPQAAERDLDLLLETERNDSPLLIHTDQGKLNSILTNLIKNAIKYTEKGRISIGYRQNKGFLEFRIADTGIGIPAHRLEAIFKRFEQADVSDSRAFQGSGLGLSIAKAYAEMLGGSITVESVEGRGSVFTVQIPLTGNIQDATEMISDEVSPLEYDADKADRKLKILIAEDDENSFLLMSTVLQEITESCSQVLTGEEAVDFCRRYPDTDLVLMDIRLPVLDGYEATRRIRGFNPGVAIIAQTAYALSGDREKALAAGCNEYIAKPVVKETLLRIIRKAMGK